MEVRFTVPGKPMAKQRPRIYNGHGVTPAQTVNYEVLVRQMYSSKYAGKMLEGPLLIRVEAYFQIAKSRSGAQAQRMRDGGIRPTSRPDWDNIGKIVSDALNGIAYHDDSQIVEAMVEKWYSSNPRVEVLIKELEVLPFEP